METLTLDAASLADIEERIRGIYAHWARNRDQHSLGAMRLRILVNTIFAPNLDFVSSLGSAIRKEKALFVKLTEEQRICLDFLRLNPTCRVVGPAGTGKTVIAIEHARLTALDGKRVALLCFNRGLGKILRSQIEQMELGEEAIWAGCYQDLCEEWADKGGVSLNSPDERDTVEAWDTFWHDASIGLMSASENEEGGLFDAIIVDEAQDLRADWWEVIGSLCRKESQRNMVLFDDPKQNIFRTEHDLPIDGPIFPLSINCRNTARISHFASDLVDVVYKLPRGVLEGTKPKTIKCADASHVSGAVNEIVADLHKGG